MAHAPPRLSDRTTNPDRSVRARSPWPLQVRFGVGFLSLTLLFAILTSTSAAQRLLHDPLSRLVVSLAAPILSILGTVSAAGTDLTFNGFAVSIVEACNGVLPTYIFVSAVLAFPSHWREKGIGMLIGIPSIMLVNVLRVVTLLCFGAYWPSLFERVHIYVWQALVIAISLAIWVFWAERFVRPSLRTDS